MERGGDQTTVVLQHLYPADSVLYKVFCRYSGVPVKSSVKFFGKSWSVEAIYRSYENTAARRMQVFKSSSVELWSHLHYHHLHLAQLVPTLNSRRQTE